MLVRSLLLVLLCALVALAQEPCADVPTYSYCDIPLQLAEDDVRQHTNPYASVELWAEFRGPDFRTKRIFGFWDGDRKFVLRYTPVLVGPHTYRVSSNVKSLDGKAGTLTSVASESSGFIQPANVHHWMHTDRLLPHLWMGDTCYLFGFVPRAQFESYVQARANQKFSHMRGLLIGGKSHSEQAYPSPDRPNPGYFQELDQRIRFLNQNGIIADLILGGDENHLAELFPDRRQRELFVRYAVARYAPMNVTWELVRDFEEYDNPRAFTKEIGLWIREMDPYGHPRSTHATATSGPLLGDGWMDYVLYQSPSVELGAIEHQLFPRPQVNAGFAYEASGATGPDTRAVSSDEYRRSLWRITMNGQYPVFGNTGVYAASQPSIDAGYLETPGSQAMTAWHEIFSRTRHWELEPYFELTGGRCIALPDVEYVIYLEKPGQVEILIPKHSYQIYWIDPATGETTKEKKDFKGTRFIGEPPVGDHDWVLHLSRDGRKEGLAKGYKFESQRILMQEIESNAAKVPYKIVEPSGNISMSGEKSFQVELTRETRATSEMMWLWTGDVVTDQQGYRFIGAGQKGVFEIHPRIAKKYPATLHVRSYGMNGVGKVYSLDTVARLEK